MRGKGYGLHLEYFDHLGYQDDSHGNQDQYRQSSAKGLIDSRLAVDSEELRVCKTAKASDDIARHRFYC